MNNKTFPFIKWLIQSADMQVEEKLVEIVVIWDRGMLF